MQIFEKMSQKALNHDLTLPSFRSRRELPESSGIFEKEKNTFFRKCVLIALIFSLGDLLHIPVINSSGDALCVELWPKPFLNRILAPMFGIRFLVF